jgi:hypothetical protein
LPDCRRTSIQMRLVSNCLYLHWPMHTLLTLFMMSVLR